MDEKITILVTDEDYLEGRIMEKEEDFLFTETACTCDELDYFARGIVEMANSYHPNKYVYHVNDDLIIIRKLN